MWWTARLLTLSQPKHHPACILRATEDCLLSSLCYFMLHYTAHRHWVSWSDEMSEKLLINYWQLYLFFFFLHSFIWFSHVGRCHFAEKQCSFQSENTNETCTIPPSSWWMLKTDGRISTCKAPAPSWGPDRPLMHSLIQSMGLIHCINAVQFNFPLVKTNLNLCQIFSCTSTQGHPQTFCSAKSPRRLKSLQWQRKKENSATRTDISRGSCYWESPL